MKQVYTKPNAEVVNLASLARIALIDERPDTRGNDDFDFNFSTGVDQDKD